MFKNNTSLFLLFLSLFSFFSISYASSSCSTAPHGAIYCQAILIKNTVNSSIVKGTQIPITYNALSYSSYLASNLQNIVFYNSANGSIITSWLEGNYSNELQNSNLQSSSNILIWINVPTNIPADYNYSNVSIAYFPNNVSKLNNITTGEAPQLSSSYAQYDNGALLFNSYQNFAGTSTPSGWHIFKTGTSYIEQDNGLSTNGLYSYGVYAIITNSTNYGLNSSRVLDALESVQNSSSLYNYYLGVGYTNGYGTAYGYSNSTFVGWSNEYGRSPISPFSASSSGGGVTMGNFTPGYLTGIFSTYWPSISKAQFYLNYNYSETINTTIPKNTLSIGIAGRTSGNLIKLYWIRERTYLANKSTFDIYFDKITPIKNTTTPSSNNSSNNSISYDQIVSFNPSLYSNYESYDLGNIRFYNGNSELYSWCESGCNSSSTNATFWVKILNETNTLNKNISVMFLHNVSQYDGIYAGEAPELSSIYGKYDNGARVFPLYDNFIGNTLNTSKWYFSECPSSYSVNDGLEVNTTHCGYYNPIPGTTSSDPSNGIMGAYITNASIRGSGFVFCWLHIGGYCSPAAGVRNGTTLLYSDKPGQDNTGYFIDSVTNNNSTFKIDWAFIATYPPNGIMPNVIIVPSLSSKISYALAENASVSIFGTYIPKIIKKGQTYEMRSSVSGITSPTISYQWFEKTPISSFYFLIPGGFYSNYNFTTNTSTIQGNYSFKLRIVANQLILFSAPFSISVSNSTYIPNVVKGLNNPSGVSVSSNGAYVYVENYGNNTISIINSSTNKILKSIKRSYEPSGMAISPNGAYVYVSNSGNNTVDILNSSSLSVVKTIYHLLGPNGVTPSLNGAYLYVTNFYNNSISIINLSTLDKVYTIHGLNGPDGIALSQNGTTIYVSNEYNNSLSIINITSRKIINTITGLDVPSDVATAPDYSYVYVPNYGNNTLSIINTTTDSVVWTISKLNLPQNIAFSLNGNYVYIAESGNNTLSVVNITNITMKLPNILKLSQLYSTSQLLIQNQSATIFSAGAFGGTKPYHYTWYERLPGEQSYTPIYSSNSSYYTFTTSNMTELGSHLFELSVSNSFATVFSAPILVQVIPRLTLSTSAIYQKIDLGQHITLAAIAKGSTGSYAYTWYNDTSGVPIKISGAISNTLYLNGTSLSKISTFPVVTIGSNLTEEFYTIKINNITGYSSTVLLSVYYNGILTNKSIIDAYILPSTSYFNAAGHLLKLIINKLNGNIVSPTLNVTVITPFQYTVNVIGAGVLNITSLDSSNSAYFNLFVNPKLVFEDPLNNTVTDSGLSTFPYTMFITGGTPPYRFLNTTIIGNSSSGFGSLQQKDNIELCGGFNNPEGFNSVQCSLSVASNATAGKYIIPITLLDSSNGLPISNSSYGVHIQINPPLNAIGTGFNKSVILDVNQQYTYSINAFNGTPPYIYSWEWSQGVGGNTNTGTMGQFFNITVLSGCSGYIGNGPLNSSCVFKAVSKNLTNTRIIGSVLDSALDGPGFSEQPKYFYSNLTIHPAPILSLNTIKQTIGTNQYENLTISVTGGVGPFDIKLYNLTGNDTVKNITLQSGDSNTVHIYTSGSGNFTYEAIGTDIGTTIPYNFNSSKLSITVI